MAEKILMPRYGANMEEGMVGEWYFQEGDSIKKGETICTIEIEKLTNELPAPASGILGKILVQAGDSAPCGAEIGIIAAEGEQLDPSAPKKVIEDKKEQIPVPSTGQVRQERKRAITPKALKLAGELGIDWSSLDGNGSGYFGMVTRDDIKGLKGKAPAAVQRTVPPPAVKSVTPGASRRVTARRMSESLQNSAQAAIWMDADITRLMSQVQAQKDVWKQEGLKLTVTPMVIQCAAKVIQEHPQCRTVMHHDGSMELLERISIALAADTPHGLMVPVIHDVNIKSLREIAGESSRLSDRAQSGVLTPDEMSGHCMTVTNLGMYGVKYLKPILNLPESVILGVGAASQQVRVIDGGMHIRWMLPLSLSFDHRTVDGAPAARFLRDICRMLEQGSGELHS